ncbi:hypothetical protein [Catellatospora chokoriensis]|uniref:Uncharacterized protein n=1 Tax=Catellatospora chokoriensis TaxID=310353 RepID=A0A8J3NR73_9ACTN|nr:hypothetical protein [Catellatospora chokoriensis]GIF89907.1 hypothetical protein Cch02nite_33510 [Catellatospora chokoriensis]
MSGQRIDLDPAAALTAARRLNLAGQSLARERDLSGGRIEQAGQERPWGDDELGRAFAARYADSAVMLLLLWRDAAHRTVELSESIVTAVAATEHVDAAGQARFRQLTV